MKNNEIADIFDRLADILEFKGEIQVGYRLLPAAGGDIFQGVVIN